MTRSRQQTLDEYGAAIREELGEYLDGSGRLSEGLERDNALVQLFLDQLEDAGSYFNPIVCPHEDLTGRNRCRLSAYDLRHDGLELLLFAGHVVAGQPAEPVSPSVIRDMALRAARFFDHAAAGNDARFADNPETRDAVCQIRSSLSGLERVTVLLFTDGLAKIRALDPVEMHGLPITFDVFDLQRMHRIFNSGSTRPDIEIAFADHLGRPLSCLEMRPAPDEYKTFLAMFPGELLCDLYDRYGPQLLEFNVRSYLQARGKVNKGILATLKDEPERFMAYNNGLTVTADEIEVGMLNGETVIYHVRGLQIVNGGQTTASIHRAGKILKHDISRVFVPVKLTQVEPEKLQEFVPLISRYSNTQNVIQIADLSANHEFHVAMERLAASIWCPGEESRWFYERARGSYQVELNLFGTTAARKREFRRENPSRQKFSKTDMAKYMMTWLGRPQVVSRGAQKNFAAFMEELPNMYPGEWSPSERFFRESVAKAILFKRVDAMVRRAGHAYKANVVTYLVAYLAHRVSGELNFERIWQQQGLSGALEEMLSGWVTPVYGQLVASAQGRNVSEWAKQDDCWEGMLRLERPMPNLLPPELAGEESEEEEDIPLAADDWREIYRDRGRAVELCRRVSAAEWTRINLWGMENQRLNYWERGVAHTMGEMACAGWKRDPTDKQLRRALRALELAVKAGIVEI